MGHSALNGASAPASRNRRPVHRRHRLTAFALWMLAAVCPALGAPPEIWFAPMQPTRRANGADAGVVDYTDLFSPGSPWPVVATHVSVFKVYPAWVRDASDDALRRMIIALSARHIWLALETPVLVETTWCKPGAIKSAWMVPLVE